MRRKTILSVLAALSLAPLFAQQDVPPPPRHTDDGPSLEATTRFIVEKLSSLGTVNSIGYIHDNIKGNDWTNEFHVKYSNVSAQEGNSGLRFHRLISRNQETPDDGDFAFLFRALRKKLTECLPDAHFRTAEFC